MRLRHPLFERDLPRSWSVCTVDDIKSPEPSSCVAGPFGSNISSKYFVDDGVPVIRGNNLSDKLIPFVPEGFAFVSEERASSYKAQHVRAGDLVFTCWGTIGQVGLIPNDGPYRAYIISNKQLKLRPNQMITDVRYLFYYFASPAMVAHIRGRAIGAAVPGINLGILKALPVVLPPLPVQHRIASILSAYDDLIENNTKRIKILEEMARSLYREWFVHFRFPGHENVKMVDSELGKVPKAWPITRLDQVYQTASGGTPSRKHPEYFAAAGAGIPWVKTKELLDGWILFTEEDLSLEGLNSSSAKIFPANTLLIAMYGATIGQLGLLGVPSATNQACCAILPAQEKSPFGPYWAWCYFLENRARIAALGLGAAQPNISQVVIRGLELVRPSAELAARFEQSATPLFETIRNLQARNWTLQRTRDLLLPRLISGEIDVSKLPLPT